MLRALFGFGPSTPGGTAASGTAASGTAAGTRGAGSEAQIKMAKHIATAILADLVQQCQKSWRHLGPGALVVRRISDDVIWSGPDNMLANIKIAETNGDDDMAQAFKKMLAILEGLDPEQNVMVVITDFTGMRVIVIPAVDPARALHEVLEACQG